RSASVRSGTFSSPGLWVGVALNRVSIFILVKPGRDQIGQRVEGLHGVRPARFQFQSRAALSGHSDQIENALAVELIAIVMNPDLRSITERELDELVGGTQVKSET